MKKDTIARFHLVKSKQTCGHCDIQQLCISAGIDENNTEKLNEIVKSSGPYDLGDVIYRRGDTFKSLYVIQCGIAKSETSSVEGRKQVTGFYFPGDLIGMESISTNIHPCDVIAIEKTWVCEIPFHKLEALSSNYPTLQHELFMRMGQKIYHDEYNCLVNRNESAEKRMLCFLTDLYKKLQCSAYVTDNCLSLPMAKVDLASYLGLQPETLSRTLKQLDKKGYIINTVKHIEFVDLDRMIKVTEN